MSADKNDVLLLCEEIAYFLFNIIHLLLTQVLPLIALLVGSLFLHLFSLFRSLLSSRGQVSPRYHAACRPAETAGSTCREAAEPLEVCKDGLQEEFDRDEDDRFGVDNDHLVYATVNDQKPAEEKPVPNDLQARKEEDLEIERSEKDGPVEAGGQDTQSLDGEGGLQEGSDRSSREAGDDGEDGTAAKILSKVVPAISAETSNQQSINFAHRLAGAFRLGGDEDEDDAREYTPPWLRPQLSMQSPSDLPPDLDGVIVAAAVNNEGRAVAALRPLAPTFSTVAKQLPPHDKKSGTSDRSAGTAGESDQPA